jgi:hypothetical protein
MTFFPEIRNMDKQELRGMGWAAPAALALVTIALGGMVAFGWMQLRAERSRADELAAKNQSLQDSLQRMESRLNELAKPRPIATISPEAPEAAPAPLAAAFAAGGGDSIAPPKPKAMARPVVRRIEPARTAKEPARDPRVDPLLKRVDEQSGALAQTREDVSRTREEVLRAQDDIARTREDLAELRRRGERNIYEFDLFKNKDFSRVGPLGLSLRKADTKRRSYQMKLRVDDQEMEKKNVNLFEPVLIHMPGAGQPLQLVVQEITKNRVKGYLSEPRTTEGDTRLRLAEGGR